MGAFVISRVAELRSERIAAAVYVSAPLPSSGASIADAQALVGERQPRLSAAERLWNADKSAMRLAPSVDVRSLFYNSCAPEDVDRARGALGWQPVRPFTEPIALTPQNYGSVPRYYVECLRDETFPPALQREVQHRHRFERVFSLETDHSPFLSAVDPLCEILTTVADDAPRARR
jgi:pimeloyl-ACP methyl ester carboxylesterase